LKKEAVKRLKIHGHSGQVQYEKLGLIGGNGNRQEQVEKMLRQQNGNKPWWA
jgi:hypothetical protein